ncbi:MAG: aminoacyl-tRNA hydrolase [Desulfobacteraceae bacterium]|nr:aminoacyl-tRNA hydrolase [Desulfobacteraceae bacterium]
MPEQGTFLIAGLGNPGPEYARTRHNAGFMVIDALAQIHRIELQRRKFDVVYGRGEIRDREVILAKPQAFMNRSGPPLQQLANFFKVQTEAMVVVHDDIDLAFTRLKIKEKGGDGGHKGIRSIIGAFGGGDFVRVRLGIGRSGDGRNVVDHVLSTFSKDETAVMKEFLQRSCDAIVTILEVGSKEAMNRFNQQLSNQMEE